MHTITCFGFIYGNNSIVITVTMTVTVVARPASQVVVVSAS